MRLHGGVSPLYSGLRRTAKQAKQSGAKGNRIKQQNIRESKKLVYDPAAKWRDNEKGE